jgi:transposase
MAPQISQQLRERIVFWRYSEHKKAPEIASLAGCVESTVYEILRLYRDFGQVTNPYIRSRGRPRTLDQGDMNYIHSILEANPTLYVDEIQQRLFVTRDVEVSITTVCRALRRLSVVHKRVAKEAQERDELIRATWQAEYGDIPMESFVWLDESSVDDRTNQRRDGWAMIGRACVRRDTFIRGQRFSVLPALTVDGIIALDIFEGSVTKDRFIHFVREQIVSDENNSISPFPVLMKRQAPQLTPWPGPRSAVVLDNCSIHHDEDVRQIIEDECGMVFLSVCCSNICN